MVDLEFEVGQMMRRAYTHLRSVNLLSSRVGDYRASGSHLGVLAFEISLKSVHISATGVRAGSHDYWSIWKRLPKNVQDEVVCAANERNAGHIDLSDIRTVLDDLQNAFTRGRYDYEFNQGLTAREAAEKGRRWIQEGAREIDADIRYLPVECDGLTYGLFSWIMKKHDFTFDFDE